MSSVYLETFGCQMNELDSELVRGHLMALGYRFTGDPAGAAVILYNTCSVRQQAENKVLSRLGLIGIEKAGGRQVIVGVIGCMAEREGASLMSRFPQVDLMCGPGELDRLPMLIDNALKTEAVSRADRVALQGSRTRRSAALEAAADNLEMLDLSRAFDPDRAEAGGRSAYVRITRGCNKFCTYCVVPFTRGAEVHRPPDSVVEECRRLADQGVIEVTLLGQTVNHYLYVHGAAVASDGRALPQIGPGGSAFADAARPAAPGRRVTTFADLLHRIHEEVPAIERLRFVTSYPRDFGDDILAVMAASPRMCRYLHVPAQSGSDRILRLMNRGYSRQEYLQFIERARTALPDVCIAGDFIVGFPGESDDDFAQTRTLLEAVRYKNSFIFKYSPRPGTAAMKRLEDDVPDAVKRRRNNELLALQGRISAEVHAAYVGRDVSVFVEKAGRPGSSRDAGASGGAVELGWERPAAAGGGGDGNGRSRGAQQMSGRTSGDLIVAFDLPAGAAPQNLLGRIVTVRVTHSAMLLLRGTLSSVAPGAGNAGSSGKPAGSPLADAASGPVELGDFPASKKAKLPVLRLDSPPAHGIFGLEVRGGNGCTTVQPVCSVQ